MSEDVLMNKRKTYFWSKRELGSKYITFSAQLPKKFIHQSTYSEGIIYITLCSNGSRLIANRTSIQFRNITSRQECRDIYLKYISMSDEELLKEFDEVIMENIL
jgi:hypothetical protein